MTNKFGIIRRIARWLVKITAFIGYLVIFSIVCNLLFYSDFTDTKIYEFYQSNKVSARVSEVIPGDWDRICFLRSHKTSDLITVLNRELSLYEMAWWNLRVDFIDFDNDGGVIVYEKSHAIQKIEWPGRQVFINKYQRCYLYHEAYFKKTSVT